MLFETGTLYLIHFDKILVQQSHYIGWAPDSIGLKERIRRHRNNVGAQLLKRANSAKIGWKVVRIWDHRTEADEAELKKWKNSKKLCPLCWASNSNNLEIGNPAFSSSDPDFIGVTEPKFFK
jgi:predicted GIY-YIG superfamily endonuclease